MEERAKKAVVMIYDEDGMMCESVSGHMGYEEIRGMMAEALKNDGIPVVRWAEEEWTPEVPETDECDREKADRMTHVHISKGDLMFAATGSCADVIRAMTEFIIQTNE